MHLQVLQQDSIADGKVPRRQLIQIEYGAPNDAMRDLYAFGGSVGKNLILTHHLTDEYGDKISHKGEVEKVITGRRILEGLVGTHRLVDVAIRMTKTPKHTLESEILKCGYNLSLEGTKAADPTWDSIVTRIEMQLAERI